QQLFLGTGTGPGGIASATGAQGPVRTTTSEPQIIPVRITVDTRTNSLIVAGAPSDLIRIEAIIANLEAAELLERHIEVYHLKNSPAVDVANALTSLFTGRLQVISVGGELATY